MQIENYDQNFIVKAAGTAQTVFFDAAQPPFTVHGLLRDAEGYYRLPFDVAAAANDGVQGLNLHTAGGRVRFCTDAQRVTLRAAMRAVTKMPHFALTGSAGFDLYADGVYRGTFIPPMDVANDFTAELTLGAGGLREITVHFPLYSGVRRLELGFPPGSILKNAPAYAVAEPVVYYGSSITQGGCASRPGNAYQNILSRRLDCDHLNLGFSGSAKGEPCMADYIAGLRMAAFVLDYDHNAPDPAHLEATHAAFFRTVRDRQPELPILLLSRPQPNPDAEELLRREIVRRTWETAAQNGDRHVFFLDGTQMLRLFGGDSGTVDGCHPNDLGFYCMAAALEPVLKAALPQAR
ncbi:MAG: hypothetical protein IKD72_01120 [Clostridia bacterium]|nr:hypothetical protein [Clostridia bacterium]